MVVGAIAPLRVAGPVDVALTPSGAGLVVFQVVDSVVVDGAGLAGRSRLSCRRFHGPGSDLIINRDEPIRLQPDFDIVG